MSDENQETKIDHELDLAIRFGRKWGAIDAEGRVLCIRCNYRPGTLPSLCCVGCLEHKRGGR
jgi:hypothetical protein